ncbi:hypothetical protein ZWY2020_032239 [Hordeum vulgare]|nr:hypothetical protein ZWY2020_032239 [Hordeum vulgare]
MYTSSKPPGADPTVLLLSCRNLSARFRCRHLMEILARRQPPSILLAAALVFFLLLVTSPYPLEARAIHGARWAPAARLDGIAARRSQLQINGGRKLVLVPVPPPPAPKPGPPIGPQPNSLSPPPQI